MLVTRVALRDFRNYERAEIPVGPGCTVVWGENGAGKTNLLEAIHFGLTGRSCRTRNERELVRHGCGTTRVSVRTRGADGDHAFEVGLEPGRVKRMLADGAPPEGSPVARSRPLVNVFLPERMELVKGPPAPRRAHLDQLVVALWPARGATRAAYARALAHRNALLGRVRAGAAGAEQLDAWDAELARHGAELIGDRARALGRLAAPFAERARELGLPGTCDLCYRPRSKARDQAGLRDELAAQREPDLARGFTTHGPHRDDLALLREGRPLRAYGSQGQQRLALLALLLAERDVLAGEGRKSLMLLDDVMSEIDAERRALLAGALGDGQTLITATDPEQVPSPARQEAMVLRIETGPASSEALVAA